MRGFFISGAFAYLMHNNIMTSNNSNNDVRTRTTYNNVMQDICRIFVYIVIVISMLKPARRLVDHFPPSPDLEPTSAKYSTFCPHDK